MFKKKTIKNILIGALIVAFALLSIFLVSRKSEASKDFTSSPYVELNNAIKVNKEQYYDGTKIFKLPSNVRDDDQISVIVKSEKEALYDAYKSVKRDISFQDYIKTEEAKAVAAEIAKESKAIKEIIDKSGVDYKLGVTYNTMLSGFEIIIKAKDFEATAKALDGKATAIVGEVYNAEKTELVENKVNVYETGIFDSSKFQYDGTGMVVAVLDTGLDYTHTAFKNFNVAENKLGLTFDKVKELLNAKDFYAEQLEAGVTAEDLYINSKVPFAFDYADGDSEVFPINSDHGTHVAGIIAGKDDKITGVAPNAQLVIMKTFSDVESTARTAWILSALEDCVALGVDVINMSLGTDCGFSRPTDKENVNKIYERIEDAGISLVVAASNSYNSTFGSEKNGNLGLTSNPDSATVGSPSTYDVALSIASISGVKTPYLLFNDGSEEIIIYFTESSDRVSEEKDFLEDILKDGQTEAEIEFVTIPGVGRMADYTGIDVKGKIALVRRGDSTFEEKANVAEQKGALGIIVYNNVSGDIKMNVGEAELGACSISQTDGEVLAQYKTGKIKVSTKQVSGPFMSDFSSWGPTPSLGIKPELTAHGGSILSAVPGQDYDRISGTSMATPNMSGVVALMRQYVKVNFPEIANDNVKVTTLVNCLLMSTADIVTNKNGLPYAVRKQGAGLANLVSAATTKAYIITYDKNGKEMDRSKLELGDDPQKTGVYTLNFDIKNFGSKDLTYDLDMIVMTEGVSETKTSHGQTTVTESGYMLEANTTINKVVNAEQSGDKITVKAGQTAKLTVTISLTDNDKKYLNDSFANGMYIEGFVQLKNQDTSEGAVNLGVPFLAFYGDWSEAPMLDLDYYATNKDELDDAIDFEDKTLPDAYATRPIGSVEGDYVNFMGSFYFEQDPTQTPIAADRKYISISNQIGSVNSLEYIWAGLLRNCQRIEVVITDDATGEVVFETVDYDVRKSYSNGQTIYPANVDIGFSAIDQNLKNNTRYTVTMKTYLDYENDGSETNDNNVFTFPLVTDFEAPAVTGVEYYTEYDKSAKKTRLFAKIAIYDNHYAMGMQVGYVGDDGTGSLTLYPFDQHIQAVYSEFNTTNYVTYELTDYVERIKNGSYNRNTFTVACYDYALNLATYEIGLPDDYVDFYFDLGTDENGNPSTVLELSPNQTFELDPKVYPDTEWGQLLEFRSMNTNVARVVNNKLIAIAPGESRIVARNPETGKSTTFTLKVHAEYLKVGTKTYDLVDGEYVEKEGGKYLLADNGKYVKTSECKYVYDKTTKKYRIAKADETANYAKNTAFKTVTAPVVDNFLLTGYLVEKAYYFLSSDQRDIGVEGDEMKFVGENYNLKMYPSEAVTLRYILDAFFPDATEVQFSSSNESIVSVDANGKITAHQEGYGSISVKVLMNGKSTFYSKSISIEVKDPYTTSGPMLANYYGNGGYVEIPSSLNITEIGQFAFSNYVYVPKQEWEIDPDSNENFKMWFKGENTITKIVIPEGVEKIGAYAFANLTELEEIVLPSTLKMIDQGAFYGCTKLKTVKGLEYVKFINQYTFYGCSLEGEIKLDNAAAVANYAFATGYITNYDETYGWSTYKAGENKFTSVVLSEKTQSIGEYAFYGSRSLEKVTINAEKVQLGMCAFADCSALTEISEINTAVIPSGLFDGCTSLENVTIGKEVAKIGEYAFSRTKIKSFTVNEENEIFFPVSSKPYILNKTGDTILLFAPGTSGAVEINDSNIKTVGANAFSGCSRITTVKIPSVTAVEDFGFAGCTSLGTVELGKLTKIGKYAFHRTRVTATHSLDGLTELGAYAYAETNVESVVIPAGLIVGEGAFRDCNRLASVEIGDGAILGTDAFRLNSRWTTAFYEENNTKYYYFVYTSPLHSLKIGKNVTIGDSAFYGAAELSSIELGEGAKIGKYAFYNADKLTTIDLSKVVSIGDYAFSGDVLYEYTNSDMTSTRFDKTGTYVYRYYSPDFTSIDLSSVTSLGSESFAYCRKLEKVTLGSELTEIKSRTFASCIALTDINLDKIEVIGRESFAESGITSVKLSSIKSVGEYAFVYCAGLASVELDGEDIEILEGAFSYCNILNSIAGLGKVSYIDNYAFAYTGITEFDLSGAKHIGDHAFMKEALTDVTVTFGELTEIGENPFAMCKLEKLSKIEKESFNGKDYERVIYTFDLSDTIKVIDGSIYRVVPNGYELITFTGDDTICNVADETVRISAMAFAGSNVEKVNLPKTVKSIGHKAFYGCEELQVVAFSSYEAPILEEEYDYAYYSSMENLPAKGLYDFTDFDGSPLQIPGLEIVPYFMYNVASTPVNIYYGANFVDYVGHVDNKIVMVKPSNGQHYDTFIFGQYFSVVIAGDIAPDDTTLAAIAAISALPETVSLSDKDAVLAARAAYNLITTNEQKSILDKNGLYAKLTKAEKRISDLEYLQNGEQGTEKPPVDEPQDKLDTEKVIFIVVIVVAGVAVVTAIVLAVLLAKSKKNKTVVVVTEEPKAEEVIEAENTADTEEEAEEAINVEEAAEAEEANAEEATEAKTEPNTVEEVASEPEVAPTYEEPQELYDEELEALIAEIKAEEAAEAEAKAEDNAEISEAPAVTEPKEKFIVPENVTSKKVKLGVDSCTSDEGIFVLDVKEIEYTCDTNNENTEDSSDDASVEE